MQNKTSLFALAMIEPNMHNTNYRNHYDSAYVNISSRPLDYEIALLYRFFPDTTEGSNEIISLDDGKYLVIYPILEKYKVDFVNLLLFTFNFNPFNLVKITTNFFSQRFDFVITR